MPREDITQHQLSDEEMTHLIAEAIASDARTHYYGIGITVDKGMVTLSGNVERPEEKQAIEEDAARIADVTQVVNNIIIKPVVAPDDSSIARDAMESLLRDGRFDAGYLEVVVNNGYVSLRGEVVTPGQERAAVDTVRLIPGVKGVNDEIIILPQETASDHMLEETVTAALVRAPNIDERQIHAHVADGIAYLSGTADFLYQKQEAERVVEGVPGMRGVENEIAVQPPKQIRKR